MKYSQRGIARPDSFPEGDLRVAGVYMLRSITTNEGYIGSSKTLYNRLGHHFKYLHHKNHEHSEVQNWYDTYGVDDIEVTILERLPAVTSAFDPVLLQCEGKWLIRLTSTVKLINQISASMEHTPLRLRGRANAASVSREYIMKHPKIIDEQLAMWQAFKDALNNH